MKKIFNELVQNNNVLMFVATVFYVLGLYAYFTDSPVVFALIVTLILVFLLLKEFSYKLIILWLAIFYFGFFNTGLRIKTVDTLFKLAPSNAVIKGQIVSIPNSSLANNTKFFFLVKDISVNGEKYENINCKTLVGVNDFSKKPDFSNLVIGNYYELEGKLRRPFVSTNPSQFSYADYLRNYKTYTTFYVDTENVKCIGSPISGKWKLIQFLNNRRNYIISAHSKYMKSPNIDILGGVVFGDDAIAPPDYIKASFINSGLLHILAASGMNVGFISGFLLYVLAKIAVPYNIRILSGISVVILYCFMTGLGASVIRAALMLIFVLFGKLINRDAHSVALLSFVALLMLIYNPAYINDVGFQLSFIVTLGIILSADAIIQYVKDIPAWLSGSIFIPIIAQLWVIPIQMFYFNTISTYSIFANILSMPFLFIISFGGFTSALFSLIIPISDYVAKVFSFILNPCLDILIKISDFFGGLPHSLCITTHPCIFQILLYYVILCIFIYLIKIKFVNKKLFVSGLILSIILFLTTCIHLPNNNFEVISFDVGNADAFLLKTPKNKYFIIDTGKMGYGGRRSQADIIMLKYMKDKGIKDIEGLVVTHFDSDHAGGAADIINSLNVKAVYLNSLKDDKRLAKEIYSSVDKKPYTYKVLAQNNSVVYKEPNFKITMYKADIPQHGSDREANENSVMTLVENGKMKMLFTGDSGVVAFNKIKNYLPKNITVLKVGHHGAKNVVDKSMIDYLNPEVSVVSVGYNKYGHPHPLTMELLSESEVVRTDKIHAIKIISNNKGYEVDGYDSKTRKFYKTYNKKYQ